jgi:peptide/nickel transport system substrate-binding protein
MNRRDRLAIVSLAVMLAIVGVAMLLPSGGPAIVQGTVTPAAAVTYREAVVGHPSSVNPLTARTQADRDLVALLFRGLVKAAPDGTFGPDLARSWNVSADGKTYTFYMASDARWEDGQPVTAADVVFTVGLASDPNYQGPLGAAWQDVTAKAVSAHVVEIDLPVPLGGFLSQATMPILPQHVLGNVSVTDLAGSDFSSRPMGDGPFRLTAIDASHAVLARAGQAPTGSPSTSESASGETPTAVASAPASAAPSGTAVPGQPISSLELRFYDDQASALAAYTAGEVDAVGGLSAENVDSALKRADSRLLRYQWASLTSVVLNQRSSHPEFASLGVRHALLSAIDRAGVLTGILQVRGSVADAPLPSWSSWYDPAAVSSVPYSGTVAAEDLANAGWTRGPDGWQLPNSATAYAIELLTLDQASNPALYQVAQQVASDWRDVGLQVSVVAAPVSDYRQRLGDGEFDAAVVEYELGLDPDVSPLFLSTQAAPAGSNLSGVTDTALDRLLQAARTTLGSGRPAAVSALEKYITSNVLMLPICFSDYQFVLSSRVAGVETGQIGDPSGRFWDVLDWRLAGAG